MLSKYQLQILEDNNFSFSKNKKLIPNLGNKGKYKTPLSELKTLFKFSVRIKKIIRTIEF